MVGDFQRVMQRAWDKLNELVTDPTRVNVELVKMNRGLYLLRVYNVAREVSRTKHVYYSPLDRLRGITLEEKLRRKVEQMRRSILAEIEEQEELRELAQRLQHDQG